MVENGKETRARLGDEVAAVLEQAHSEVEKIAGQPNMPRTKVLDFVIIRGLHAIGLGRFVAHLWASAGEQR